MLDFTSEDSIAKLIDFQQFTLIDVELEEDGDKGINVFGYNDQGDKILDIDVDALVSGFYNKYSGQYNSGNLSRTNKTQDGVAYDPATDPEPSFSLDGVTLYQEGQQLGNNTVFRFEIDENNGIAQGLSQIKFQYADVSGAISGVKWSDTETDSPESVPESSMLLGLVMLGTLGVCKRHLRKISPAEIG